MRGFALRLRWHAQLFEYNWKMASARVASRCLPHNPYFIIGLWRSGTTIFHELLAAITGWPTPNTWQCFNPSTCFLLPPPSSKSAQRPMDGGRITTLSPQEDEFALLLLGEPSLYRAFIDPRRLGECAEELWSGAASQEGNALARWQLFLRGLSSGAAPLLLKSPTHTFRLPLLRRLFPEAKFIWVGRQIGDVLASNVRMWHSMVGTHGLWACPDQALEQFLLKMLDASALVLTACLDEMPKENLLWVDFESLQENRLESLQRVLKFIGLDQSSGSGVPLEHLKQAIAAIPVHQGQRSSSPLGAAAEKLQRLMAAARHRFG